MICRDLRTFGRIWAKKCSFGSKKTLFLGQNVPYYMVHIAYLYWIEFTNLQSNAKQRICRKNSKYAPDENFCGYFCPRWKAVKFCHPVSTHCTDYRFSLIDSERPLGNLVLPIPEGSNYFSRSPLAARKKKNALNPKVLHLLRKMCWVVPEEQTSRS